MRGEEREAEGRGRERGTEFGNGDETQDVRLSSELFLSLSTWRPG